MEPPEGFRICDQCDGFGGSVDYVTAVEPVWYVCEECDGEGLCVEPDWDALIIIRSETMQDTGP